eukprot:TRINITY_DN67547_c0_g1_i1.p1 TRINITY_DN67547_c0_g1~~TRINITY_DN67547_c0_g1_i1.p1  ORF type:complete len:213 (-),score=66.72 TRINITY_DN67547_c0_g1_i1:161-748(-)
MSANKLEYLTEDISFLRNLKSLFLNQNRLVGLPDEIGELAKLELLSLSYNFLSSLPSTLPNLSFLRELKMSGNKLQQFPLEVTFLPNLQLLDLSLNQIQELPDAGLLHLAVVDLNLNENLLHYLGNDLWMCQRLKVLRLQNNQLSINSIPEPLLADSTVSTILLEGNMFELKALHQLDGYEQYMERFTASRRKLD